MGAGARASGLGEAYTAMAEGADALYWNQAGLSRAEKKEAGMTHTELPSQTRHDFAGFAYPAKFGVMGMAATYMSQGSLEGRDPLGRPAGKFGASDFSMQVSMARKVQFGARLGMGVKYVHSSIAEASANTFAVDLGGQYDLSMGRLGTPYFGLAVQNLGPGLKYSGVTEDLPLTVAAGLGLRLPMGLGLALDLKRRPYSGETMASFGSEFALARGLALRAGYGGGSSSRLSGAAGFATGLGLRAYGYGLDYSIAPFAELGQVHKISLGARF
ncbi:MAG: PorV/PorQ family protein [Elusimicrobia bacterium]|nr:PorV/PorQ family protein [Elusimicrobiota bacterium]